LQLPIPQFVILSEAKDLCNSAPPLPPKAVSTNYSAPQSRAALTWPHPHHLNIESTLLRFLAQAIEFDLELFLLALYALLFALHPLLDLR
jgi:hypothetical protein